MALCIATSFHEKGKYDPADHLKRYVKRRDTGYLGSTGRLVDIGTQTANSLSDYEYTREPYRPATPTTSSGNGGLMRLAPVPIAFSTDIELAGRLSGDSSRTTHSSAESCDACWAFGQMIAKAIHGETKAGLQTFATELAAQVTSASIATILAGSYQTKTREQISSSGYVAHTLEAALWAWAHTDSFEEGAVLAVNLGQDADTVGAVYGQLAGAYYGLSGIPTHWVSIVHNSAWMIALGERLARRAGTYKTAKYVP